MTISPTTRAELRRLHDEARAATDAYYSSGGDRLLAATADDALALWRRAACRNLLPLLDALEAAEAERDRLREAASATAAKARRLLRMNDGEPGAGKPLNAVLANFLAGLLPETGWTTQRLWQADPAGGHQMRDAAHDLVDILRAAIGEQP